MDGPLQQLPCHFLIFSSQDIIVIDFIICILLYLMWFAGLVLHLFRLLGTTKVRVSSPPNLQNTYCMLQKINCSCELFLS